ncbi:MAG: hypothetical protein COB60_08525 [Flavobacteriaceae bacterium]|nr:MAG: hypothetical protein COB60_08525 [Flavobacteriaceae bacterium]
MDKFTAFFKQHGYTDIECVILNLFYYQEQSSYTFFEIRKNTGLPKNILNRSLNHFIKINELTFIKDETSRKRLFSIPESAILKTKVAHFKITSN